jgi:hypothetical protein
LDRDSLRTSSTLRRKSKGDESHEINPCDELKLKWCATGNGDGDGDGDAAAPANI